MKKRMVLRLERSGSFWEIARDGSKVSTRYGKLLSAGRASPAKDFASAKEAQAAADELIAAKRREGYAERVVRGEAGASSRKGVSVRNPELEAVIEEEPSEAERYLVYADWLQQHGDPRGELIIVQHGIATSDDDRAITLFERDERELFKKFEKELLGPIAKYTFVRHPVHAPIRIFSWRYGFVRGARVSRVLEQARSLEQLCTHPSGRFLEHVVLHSLEDRAADVLGVLRRCAPKTLRSVRIDQSWDQTKLDDLWAALPQLRELDVATRIRSFGELPKTLESLTLRASSAENLRVLREAVMPNLRALRVTPNLPFEAKDVSALLGKFPGLEQLTVRRWVNNERGRMIPQDDLAIELVAAAGARRLARLDLELPLSADGAAALARSSSRRAIGELRLPRDGVPRAARAPLDSVIWMDEPEEGEPELQAIDVSPR